MSLAPPFVAVAIVVGVLWVVGVAIAFPPLLRHFPRILCAGLVGSLVGQIVATQFDLADPLFGDAHLGAMSIGSLVVSSIVRRFSA